MNKHYLVLSTLVFLISLQAYSNESHPEGTKASTSLGWLINGNSRFVKHKFRSDGASHSDVVRLSSGQKPHAIVLSCSDSRVPPEVIFDQKLGEIFVVRTAGESLGDNVIGSIEYAVEHLGSQLIVVMGHTSCGAVKAAYGTLGGSSAGTPALDAVVKDIHPHLLKFKDKKPSENYEMESWANTTGTAKNLISRSKLLKEKIESGALTIVSSLYDINSGVVTFSPSENPKLTESKKIERKAAQEDHP